MSCTLFPSGVRPVFYIFISFLSLFQSLPDHSSHQFSLCNHPAVSTFQPCLYFTSPFPPLVLRSLFGFLPWFHLCELVFFCLFFFAATLAFDLLGFFITSLSLLAYWVQPCLLNLIVLCVAE